MLVLTRKQGQRLKLGEDITITIVRIDKHSVRVGVEAPSYVTVDREEIADERALRADPELLEAGMTFDCGV